MTKKSHNKKIKIKSDFLDSLREAARPVLGVALGLLAGALLISLYGVNPLTAYKAMLQGAFGSPQAFTNVLVRSSPLLLGGIGMAIGVKAGIWNTGMEGYMYIGAIGAAIVGIANLQVPPLLHIILALFAGMLLAALWGLIPAYLRAYRGVNEVTATIMLNYIAIYLASFLVQEPSPMAEAGAFFPMSKAIQTNAQLPVIFSGTSLHSGVFFGFVMCIIFHFILKYTPMGFRTRMLGINREAARYSGVNTRRQIIIVMIIGAVMGGLAGGIEIIGLKQRVYMNFVDGIGYEAVAVALLAKASPMGVIFASLFFSALKAGGAAMAIQTGVGASMITIIQALCVLFTVGIGSGKLRGRDLRDLKESKLLAKEES